MRKSLGTGIDPLDLIDAHGADATRFGLLAMSSTQDVRFSEEKIAQGRRSRTSSSTPRGSCCCACRDGAADEAPRPRRRRSRTAGSSRACSGRAAETAQRDRDFEFHRAALGLYDFVYGELCDWYLELVKPRLYADDDAEVSRLALHVLAETLAIAHPVIPFVTEEIWAHCRAPRPADGPSAARRRDAARSTPPPRRRSAARSPRCRRCAAGATASAPRRRPCCRRGSQADGYERTAAHVARLARVDLAGADGAEPVATVTVPGGAVAVLPPTPSTSAPRQRRRERRAWLRRGDRARRGQARQRGLRGQGARGGGRGRAREARPPSEQELRRSRDAGPARAGARSTCSALELFGMRFGLERMRRLLTALGSPQERFRAIHVVGTNGKSSTVRMAAAMLEATACARARSSRRT